jgi:ABC-type uncharacterized transport system ATPase subunit
MVHQHFRLVEPMTVAENVALGDRRDGRSLRLDRPRIESRVAELGARYGLALDPRARVWQLSVGEQPRVEILKALYRDARILILDEPTGVLTPHEAEGLFGALRQMASDGRTVIFISHKLNEVIAVSQRITVLSRRRRERAARARRGDHRDQGSDARCRAGIAFVPEDRFGTGVAPGLSIAANLAFRSYREPAHSRGPLLLVRRIREHALELIARYRIAALGPSAPARVLSGGNLQ